MQKGSKVAVIIVLVLVVLFGVGQFFALSGTPAATTPTPAPTPTTPATPPTQVIAYAAPTPATSTPMESGSCWTNSIAAPFRSDAWRCAVGNGISDPCFQISGSKNLLCNINPTKPDSTSTFVLKLTKALPTLQPPPDVAPSDWAWLVQLQDGTLCSPFTGTSPFDATGDAASYGCAPGPLGDNLMIFGSLNNSSTAWTAQVGTFSQAPANSTSGLPILQSSSTVGVAAVWQ